MKTIQPQFTSKGFLFILQRRETSVRGVDVVLFKKVFPADAQDPEWVGWEVMIVKVCKKTAYVTDKRTGEQKVMMEVGDEFLPADSQWGDMGWSYYSEAEAIAKFNAALAQPAKEGK